jgi:hypothetical protein
MTPNDPRTKASTCKSSGTQLENSEAWISRIQALTVKEMTSKAHMQVHTNKESCEKQPGRKSGPKRAWAGRPGPTVPAHSGPGSLPPLPYVFVYLLPLPPFAATSNKSFYRRHSPEARGGLQAAGPGVFPSFIATIFVDDVLRSLHHPYVLQSL